MGNEPKTLRDEVIYDFVTMLQKILNFLGQGDNIGLGVVIAVVLVSAGAWLYMSLRGYPSKRDHDGK